MNCELLTAMPYLKQGGGGTPPLKITKVTLYTVSNVKTKKRREINPRHTLLN